MTVLTDLLDSIISLIKDLPYYVRYDTREACINILRPTAFHSTDISILLAVLGQTGPLIQLLAIYHELCEQLAKVIQTRSTNEPVTYFWHKSSNHLQEIHEESL